MPLYEYQCESCGHVFEVMQRLSDGPPSSCPECEATEVRKRVSAPAFQFKGSGWYVTDYAKKSTSEAGKSSSGESSGDSGESSDSSGNDSSSSSSTESKSSESKSSGTSPSD